LSVFFILSSNFQEDGILNAKGIGKGKVILIQGNRNARLRTGSRIFFTSTGKMTDR